MNNINSNNNKYHRTESFIVNLDSRNATSYNNSSYLSDVIFDLKYPIKRPNDCLYMTCCLQSFTTPISWYLINETNNLLVIYMVGLNLYNVYIPYGNYNAITFQTALLNVLPSGFSITLNSITNKFTLTHNLSDFQIYPTSTIYQIMGFSKSQLYNSYSNILILPFTCNFSGLNSFNILVDNIKTSNLDSYEGLSHSSIVSTIPINNASNGVLYFQKYNDFNFDIYDDTIDLINIIIQDDLEQKINFNNQNWNLVLQFNYIRNVEMPYENNFNDIVLFGK